jgi:hypothetical protein
MWSMDAHSSTSDEGGPTMSGRTTKRPESVILISAAIAWQGYMAWFATSRTPAFQEIFVGLGDTLPQITRIYLNTYQYCFAVPILHTLAMVVWLRMPAPSRTTTAELAASAVSAALLLQAWIYESLFQPMLRLIEELGR